MFSPSRLTEATRSRAEASAGFSRRRDLDHFRRSSLDVGGFHRVGCLRPLAGNGLNADPGLGKELSADFRQRLAHLRRADQGVQLGKPGKSQLQLEALVQGEADVAVQRKEELDGLLDLGGVQGLEH